MKLDFLQQRAEAPEVQITRFLRRQIVTGAFDPGERLPSTSELARRWRVSNSVIQRAIEPLAAEGLMARRAGVGTFIQPSTEKASVALVFGPSLVEESAHFYRAMQRGLQEEIRTHSWSCRVYEGLNPSPDVDASHMKDVATHIEHDLQNHAFKGLVLVGMHVNLSKLLERDIDLPIVVCHDAVVQDSADFLRTSVVYLARDGRRRLVFLESCLTDFARAPGDPVLEALQTAAKKQGLPPVDRVTLPRPGSAFDNDTATQQRTLAAIAAWRARPEGLPDGLIVSDDIAMRGVAFGLMRSGVNVPEEVRIVTHANDRVRMNYGIPVTRYEFPVEETAKRSVEILWKRILNEPLPPLPIVLKGTMREDGGQCAVA